MNRISKYIFKIIFILLMAVIGLTSVFYIAPQVDQKAKLEKSRDELENAIQLKKSEISQLVGMQQDFSSDHEFVEYIGHQNKRVWENEVIFIFDAE